MLLTRLQLAGIQKWQSKAALGAKNNLGIMYGYGVQKTLRSSEMTSDGCG